MTVSQRTLALCLAGAAGLLAACEPDKFILGSRGTTSISCPAIATLTIGTAASGDLGTATCHATDGTRVEIYKLPLAAPTPVDIAVDAVPDSAFDPRIALYRDQFGDTTGAVALADDNPADASSFNPRMHTVLAAGNYVLAVRHWAPYYGAFSVRVSEGTGSADNCWDPYTGLPALWVTPGTTSQQTLTSTDCRNTEVVQPSTQWGDLVGIYLETGQAVAVTATSLSLDTQLVLYDARFRRVKSDDNSAGGLNARLTISAASASTYFVVVTAPPQKTGEYALAVTAGSAAAPTVPAEVLGAPRSPTAGAATVRAWDAWVLRAAAGRAKSGR